MKPRFIILLAVFLVGTLFYSFLAIAPSSDLTASVVVLGEVPDTSIIAYYKFDSNVLDYSGNENNGVNYGAIFTDGKVGNSLLFDGNDYVQVTQVPSSSSLNVGKNFSISAWINPSSLPSWQTVFERGANTGSRILLYLSGDEVVFGVNNKYWGTNTGNLQTGNWYHIVGVHDGTSNREYIYINGVLNATSTGSIIDAPNTGNLRIGKSIVWNAYPFYGKIDEVRLHNKSLSSQEALDLYNSAFVPPVCGNNITETGETCDGKSLAGKTCSDFGYDFGDLSCNSSCTGFITSECHYYFCGNNVKEGGEFCDGIDLAGKTCSDFGFNSGSLSCLSNCSGFDTSQCVLTCVDNDNDGYNITGGLCGLVDCNDNDSSIHPFATEIECNEIDEDCNGIDLCLDTTETIVYYPFDSDVLDYSGNENHGVNYGAVFSSGIIGNSLLFDGNDYVEVSNLPSLNTGKSYSISAWINPSSFPSWQTIFERGSNTGSRILLYLSGDEVVFGTNNNYWGTNTGNLQTGNWYHVVGVHNSETDTDYIYINGVLNRTATGKTADPTNSGKLRIGKSIVWNAYSFYGKIDDTKLFNKSLNSEEVLNIYNSAFAPAVCGNNIIEQGEMCDNNSLGGKSCSNFGYDFGTLSCNEDCLGFDLSECQNYICGNNVKEGVEQCDGTDDSLCPGLCLDNCICNITKIDMQAYYPFDSDVLDYSGNENNGINYGAVFSSGIIGNSLLFDGNDYVEVSNLPSLNTGKSYSISAWINPSSFPSWQTIFERGSNTGSRILLYLSGDEVVFGTNNNYWGTNTGNLKAGNWYHVVGVHNSETDTEYIYINGVLNRTAIGKTADPTNSGKLRIGKSIVWNSYPFYGKIDDAKLFNKSLNSEEVLNIYSLVSPEPIPETIILNYSEESRMEKIFRIIYTSLFGI